MHPNLTDLLEMTDRDIESKIAKLNSIYFMTTDEDVRHQMILLLDTFKVEQQTRALAVRKKQAENRKPGDNDLDSLIRVS
jgi:hypothetical protein